MQRTLMNHCLPPKNGKGVGFEPCLNRGLGQHTTTKGKNGLIIDGLEYRRPINNNRAELETPLYVNFAPDPIFYALTLIRN